MKKDSKKTYFFVFIFMTLLFVITSCSAKEKDNLTENNEQLSSTIHEYTEKSTIVETTYEQMTDGTEISTENPDIVTENLNTTIVDMTEKTTIKDKSNDPKYIKALEIFEADVYSEIVREELEIDYPKVYFVDLNKDGYKDIVYNAIWFPFLAIYDDGKFIRVELTSEVCVGSLFPSGKNSGYFIDSENGVIVVRYGGHTEGTQFYNGAEAFKINEGVAESMWKIYSDQQKYFSDNMSEEDTAKAVAQCFNEFESVYRRKTEKYNLVNFYDVYEDWDVKK